MEALLFGSLGYLGNSMNEQSKKNSKKKSKKVKRNNYSSNMSNKINSVAKKQAKKIKNEGFASQFDTLMFDNPGEPVSSNFSGVIKRDGFSGYDVALQRDLDFKNGYSEFGNTQMHYDVVPTYEMMSSNMVPSTSRRDLPIQKDYSHKLAVTTGNDELYMSKDNFDPPQLL